MVMPVTPNGELPKLPPFPTQFTEKEQERLEKIEEQRKVLEGIYQAKFTPEQWAKVPVPERAVREFLPSWLSPVVKALTPWEEGAWDYGFTPEQAQEYRFELEEEYKELSRQGKVTRLLPEIQADLMIAAISGQPITDISELLSDFPELRADFTEEERAYLSNLAQALVHASPEDILSGKVFAYDPAHLPITQEDIETLSRVSGVDPRFITSTVAFAKDLEEITTALRQAYPPQVEEVAVEEGVRQRLLDYFKQRNIELGITPEEGEPIQDTLKRKHEKIAEGEGELLTLRDEESGILVSARKKPDNTVWIGDELLGYYDATLQKVVPFDLRGEPLLTEEAQEGKLKDLWDSFYLGLHQAWYGTKQALLSVIPQSLVGMTPEEKLEREARLGIEFAEEIGQQGIDIIKTLQINQNLREAEYQEWVKDHPELAPRPEYTQNPLEHTELFRDPYFYAYTIISNAPIIGTALIVGIGTTLATRNPWAGAIAGAAVITPVEIHSVYEDLIANGADPTNAAELATNVGVLIGAVEILPGFIVLRATSPVFMRLFRRNLQKELSKNLVTRLSVKKILGTATVIEVTETLEEVIQQSMQNAAVQTVNENRNIIDNLAQTAVVTAIAVAPLALFGGGAEYVNMKSHLPKKTRDEIDAFTKIMEEAGLTPQHAEAAAFAEVTDSEQGQAIVEEAVKKMDEKLPTPDKVAPEKVRLDKKLETVGTDIDVYISSILAQEETLAKMQKAGELPSELLAQQTTISDLKETLVGLEETRTIIVKKLKKMEEVAMPAPEEAVKPSVVEPSAPEAMPEQLIAPDPDVGRELTPEGRPRIKDWIDDQEDTETAVSGIKSILSRIVPSKEVREANTEAERVLGDLHSRLDKAKDEEEIQAITDEFGELAKESGISKKKLLASNWNDLTPPERASLALATIPDKSITFPTKLEVFDMRYYLQFLEEKTGLPFYQLFKRVEISHGAARVAQEEMLLRVGTDPNFTHIRTDEAALDRVAQEVNARNPRLNIEHPEELSDQELLLANVIGELYKHYEPKVRYLRFMRVAPNMESLKEAFPDAVEAGKEVELAIALELRNKGELDGLYSFLETSDWGVIGSGYDPWMVSLPTLTPAKVTLGTTRGAARLMRRETAEFPQGMERNVLLRLATYIKQMEAQWHLEPELDALEDLWSQAGDKIVNMGQVESSLREWTRELQGIPTRQSFFDSVVRRVWRQAMSAVFLHPWMAFRNFHQALAFHPDRTELFKLLTQKPSARMQEMGRIYFDSFVSQLKGIRRDWLYMGERGLPGLGWLTRMSDSLSLYSHSDNIPRWWSFEASMNKAMRATEEYQQDKDVGKWLKNSGAIHLRQTERNYALQLLAQPTFDLAVPGLREVTGGEMVSLYIGQEIANMTHFIYERAFRAPVELGATGRTLFNLIVFPRGYFQRVYLQGQKLPTLSEVFSQETDWEQARAGFKDVLLLMIVGIMISEWLKKVTGRPRRAYNPADIVQWQLGGLVIGVGMDLTKLISDVVVALDPTVDPEFKKQVLSRLPKELIRQVDVLVPFYRNLLDSIEASTDTKNIDVHMLRQLRALLDKDYTPEEIEEMDRNLWEKLRKAVLAGEPPDPTAFQAIQEALIEAQARLGEMDAEGRFYTLRQFAGDIRTQTKPLPDDMLTEQYNFSDLVIFYKESEDNWEEMYKIKSSPASLRKNWRENNIETEAMLLFWGMYSTSVFRRGTPQWNEVSGLLKVYFDLYGIDKRMHGEWADWTLPVGA